MYHKEYSKFVRPTNEEPSKRGQTPLDGVTARKIYLEEIGNLEAPEPCIVECNKINIKGTRKRKKQVDIQLSNQQLFQCVQNNDVDRLRQVLDTNPDKINAVDEFGWSLLMIACQANSIDAVKDLLQRGIDTSIRDKAGNSAQSLIIKNKNIALADLLLNHNKQNSTNHKKHEQSKIKHIKEEYICETCDNRLFDDKQEHLSSTVHNINLSKGKKIPTNYVIPESNKGFQIMLKVGWDREAGLGPDGSGKKYPIKTVLKNDKRGLGLKKVKNLNSDAKAPNKSNKKTFHSERDRNRQMEIDFRRQFY